MGKKNSLLYEFSLVPKFLFLLASPKGTVPVLVINKKSADKQENKPQIIDESLAIMLWALDRHDPENLRYSEDKKALSEMLKVIEENDAEFEPNLAQYKRAKRFHGNDKEACRLACEPFNSSLRAPFITASILDGRNTPTYAAGYVIICKADFLLGER